MNEPTPYSSLPPAQFWRSQVTDVELVDIDYDACRKFSFDIAADVFATSGSCFAQHFGRELARVGGRLLMAETRHPLVHETANHGYGLFSARYGNVYTTRQLRELIEQAFGARTPIMEFVQNRDGRWIDMLRPRATGDGFSSHEEAAADRLYHLGRVRTIFDDASVFVFTMGLTECWVNRNGDYVYPVCPGTAAGSFDAASHEFKNLTYGECLDDMQEVLTLITAHNPKLRVLLTVSPVMLVASCEAHGALQSSVASKSILRAVADTCQREWAQVDYFPSYEIISGPQSRGRFYDAGGRDVVAEGVEVVMSTFFRSRTSMHPDRPVIAEDQARAPAVAGTLVDTSLVERALQAECDELLLDPNHPR